MGFGLRKCSGIHQIAVCSFWRAKYTSERQQTFGLPPMGIFRVEAGEEPFPIPSPAKPCIVAQHLARLLIFLSVSTKNTSKPELCSHHCVYCACLPFVETSANN